MAGRDQRRLPLPEELSPAERDFYLELRRLVDVAGLTYRALEIATSGGADFYSKSRWGRWLNGQSQPPRKAIKKLADTLAREQVDASHLVILWDKAFAPVPQPRQPANAPPGPGQPPPDEPAPDQRSEAAEKLAELVARDCAAELDDQVLQGREPLEVRWQLCEDPCADPTAARDAPSGDADAPSGTSELATYVANGHRLVVLGPGGAGKSTLALLLMQELIASRRPGDPVPVILPATSAAPAEMVKRWLGRTVADRYPSLRDTRAYGAGATEDLIARHLILPVIDGLDELEPGQRAQLIDALSRAFPRSHPLIVTCRPGEYREAVEASGHVMPGATVISLRPVSAEDAARYLEIGTAGPLAGNLRPIAAAIRSDPASPLAKALSNPLMIGLLRSGQGDVAAGITSAGDECDQPAIENRILEGIVSVTLESRATSEQDRPEYPWTAADATRWLTFLARHLARLRSYDLDWTRLRFAMPAFTSPVRRATLGAVLTWIVAGTIFGLSRGVSFGAGQGVLYGLAHGVDAALIVGTIYLLAPLAYPPGVAIAPWLARLRRWTRTMPRATLAIPAAYAVESGVRDGIGAARIHPIATGALLGLTAGLLNWLVAVIIVGLAARARLFDLADKPVYFSLHLPGRGAQFARTLAVGFTWGAGLGLVIGYGIKILSGALAHEHPLWVMGVPAGAVIGTAFALIQWGRTPVAAAPSASPASTLRADRNLVLVLAVPFLVVLPVFFGTAFGGMRSFGLYGLGIGATIWLAIALSHTWPQYLVATTWLAARRDLPWRAAAFLEEAHRLRILMRRGGSYQFRHSRLQDHLAAASPTAASRERQPI